MHHLSIILVKLPNASCTHKLQSQVLKLYKQHTWTQHICQQHTRLKRKYAPLVWSPELGKRGKYYQ